MQIKDIIIKKLLLLLLIDVLFSICCGAATSKF